MRQALRRWGLAAVLAAALGSMAGAASAAETVRVGYQKYGTFLLLKARGLCRPPGPLRQSYTPRSRRDE